MALTLKQDAERKAQERATQRDLSIPAVRDPARRAACEADDCLWLRTYCEDVFYNPFTPHQERIIADCGQALRYGTQKCKAAPRGDGKALAIDTPIPTPTGWATMGSLRVGDQVFDECGRICNVLATTEVMLGRPCYRVSFSDGASLVADENHLWAVFDRWAHENKTLRVLNTWFMSPRVNIGQRPWPERRYSIPVASALELPARDDLPIDPYVLGIWLGDGTTSSNTVTVADDETEILEHFGSAGVTTAIRRRPKGSTRRANLFLIGGTMARGGRSRTGRMDESYICLLRNLGVLNNKHIPSAYLRASKEQRLSLLQGLMDSDGYPSHRKATQCEFATKFPALRDGILELLNSLGFKATVSSRYVTLNGKRCGPYYRVFFTAYKDTPVFRIKKKLSKLTERPSTRQLSKTRQIVSIDPVESVPVRCIQVDSLSRLFLAGRAMIPTHNSSIVKYLTLKYSLCRQVSFPLIVSATSEKSKKTLSSLKHRLSAAMRVDRKNVCMPVTPLGEDYPLECAAAAYVHPWPSRARNVTANGQRRIHVEWGADMAIIPTWEDEEPLGPIILALGITSDEIQGCNVYDLRPDFVILDDLDSRDSLAAEDGVVAGKIIETVSKTIAGLGGQNRRLGKFMLCTITSRESAAFRYSDPGQEPSWSGERIPAIIEWPKRQDLWQTYVEFRQWGQNTFDDDKNPVDPFGRKAHAFLLENFDEMHVGATLSNPHNFIRELLPDGTPTHVSALQRCYDYIADEGLPSFQTEHQNDPPEDDGETESGIHVRLVQTQVSGVEQGIVPEGCTILVHGVDVGKWWLHWVVRAFRPDGTGFTIDYGRQNVYETKYGSEEGLDRAIKREVIRRVQEFRDTPYGKQFREALTLVDSGYRTEAVYAACSELGMGVMPIKGIGFSAGVAERGRFNDVMRRTKDKTPVCDGVYYSAIREPGRPTLKLVCASADQWKAWEHDRWTTATDKPGCMFLYGEKSPKPELLSADQREHGHYAHHICAEVEVEDIVKGGIVRKWKAKNKENHWLDASYYADVAAAILGIRTVGTTVAMGSKARPTARELAERARR